MKITTTRREHEYVSLSVRKKIKERDNNRCMKCGRMKCLEVHHIVPVIFGGNDKEWNLITLCKTCHREAPNKPFEFYKWASTRLPPSLDVVKDIATFFIFYCMMDEETNKLFLFKTQKEFEEKSKTIKRKFDEFILDFWKVRRLDSNEQFSKFMGKYIPRNELFDVK